MTRQPIIVASVLPDARWGGPIKRTLLLAPYLERLGVKQKLFLPRGKIDQATYEGIRKYDLPWSEVPFDALVRRSVSKTAANLLGAKASTIELSRAFAREDINLVHVNGSLCWQPLFAARRNRIPALVHFNDVAFFPINKVGAFVAKRLATQIVASSEAVKRFHSLGDSAPVIVPPLDRSLKANAEPPDRPTEYAWGGYNVCALGNVNSLKGYHLLLDALGMLRDEDLFGQYKVWVVGAIQDSQKEYYQQLSKKLASLDLQEQVIFLGGKPDPWPYLWHAQGFVSSAVSEAWSMATAEAAFTGLPIVAFAAGGVPELLRNVPYAQLVRNKDTKGLAEALRTMLKGLDINVRNQPTTEFLERTDPERIAHQWFQLYMDMRNGQAKES